MSDYEPLLDVDSLQRAPVSKDESDFLRASPMVEQDEGASPADLGRQRVNQSDEFRSKLASIHKTRSGGFLNWNNWGWLKRRRERKLRAKFAGLFDRPQPANPLPRSILKTRGGRIHDENTRSPGLAQAEQAREVAFTAEAGHSAAFEPGGQFAGSAGPKLAQGGKYNKAAAGLSNLLGGGVIPPRGLDDARDSYGEAMEESWEKEQELRHEYGKQHLADQGNLAFQGTSQSKRALRSAYFTGFWRDGEFNNPKPTRQAATNKRVRFNVYDPTAGEWKPTNTDAGGDVTDTDIHDAYDEQGQMPILKGERDENRQFVQKDGHGTTEEERQAYATKKQNERDQKRLKLEAALVAAGSSLEEQTTGYRNRGLADHNRLASQNVIGQSADPLIGGPAENAPLIEEEDKEA